MLRLSQSLESLRTPMNSRVWAVRNLHPSTWHFSSIRSTDFPEFRSCFPTCASQFHPGNSCPNPTTYAATSVCILVFSCHEFLVLVFPTNPGWLILRQPCLALCLSIKGNNLIVGNKNNPSISQVTQSSSPRCEMTIIRLLYYAASPVSGRIATRQGHRWVLHSGPSYAEKRLRRTRLWISPASLQSPP